MATPSMVFNCYSSYESGSFLEKENTRWQHEIRSPKGGLAYIYKTKDLSDILLLVAHKKFKAHGLILRARSPRFCTLLDAAGPDKKEIRINDVKPDAFEIMFNFIYTNKIDNLANANIELVLEVNKAARLYGQRSLKEKCEEIIKKWEIYVDTVVSMLQMSDDQYMRDLCWSYLMAHSAEVLASDGILEATTDTLTEMFERGCFERVPAMERLIHVVRWASQLFPDQPDFFRIREHLLVPSGNTQKCLMSWIGFQRLNVEQLGKVLNDYPRLLNDSEFTKFFQHLTAPADRKPPLPSWIDG